MERRTFLGILGAGLLKTILPKSAFAQKSLRLRYENFNSELALRVYVRKGESYASISKLYTGKEANYPKLIEFNFHKIGQQLREGDSLFIPFGLIRSSLRKTLDENEFSLYKIGAGGVYTLWDIAMLTDNPEVPSVDERIDIIIALNYDINPITKRVFPDQRILVPKSWILKKSPKVKEVKTTKGTSYSRVTRLRHVLVPNDVFGARRVGGRRHEGIDLGGPVGTKLYPIENGVVLLTGIWNRRNGLGVKYKTDSGLEVIYIHLSKIIAKRGQRISPETPLGEIGYTGNASIYYPHVHVQIRKNGRIIDPTPYVLE